MDNHCSSLATEQIICGQSTKKPSISLFLTSLSLSHLVARRRPGPARPSSPARAQALLDAAACLPARRRGSSRKPIRLRLLRPCRVRTAVARKCPPLLLAKFPARALSRAPATPRNPDDASVSRSRRRRARTPMMTFFLNSSHVSFADGPKFH